MKEIKISQGKTVMVDDSDYEFLSHLKWQYAVSSTGDRGYAKTSFKNPKQSIAMHNLLTGLWFRRIQKHVIVDHIDGNGLNNQRSNLRLCTQSQNQFNKRLQKNSSTGFKGVCIHHVRGKLRYRARVTIGIRLRKDLGVFKTAEEAARAYDEAAKKYFGEFALVNLHK